MANDATMDEAQDSASEFFAGVRASFPVMVSAGPFGLLFGALAFIVKGVAWLLLVFGIVIAVIGWWHSDLTLDNRPQTAILGLATVLGGLVLFGTGLLALMI